MERGRKRERVMYEGVVAIEYACVREEMCRYSFVSEENVRKGTESGLMRDIATSHKNKKEKRENIETEKRIEIGMRGKKEKKGKEKLFKQKKE